MPRVKLSEITIAYERAGQGDPLLMIMGIGAQLTQWPKDFCQALRDQGFDLIKPDNRDCGLSTKLIDQGVPDTRKTMLKRILGQPIRAGYQLEDMAGDLQELLDHLGIARCHVVGISMGSMIAQILAGSQPHRVRSLTLMHSNTGKRRHHLSNVIALHKLTSRSSVSSRGEYIEGFVELFHVIGSPKLLRPDDEMRKFAAESYDRSHHPPGFSRQMHAVLASGDREKYYRKITCPTRIIHGKIDPIMPLSGARTLQASISKAKLHIYPDLGHDIPPSYAVEFANIIRENANESTD